MNDIGRFLRQYRIKHNMLLRDMAEAMGVDSAWLSSIEHGRRAIPTDFSEMVTSTFKLSQLELRDLKNALEDSK